MVLAIYYLHLFGCDEDAIFLLSPAAWFLMAVGRNMHGALRGGAERFIGELALEMSFIEGRKLL